MFYENIFEVLTINLVTEFNMNYFLSSMFSSLAILSVLVTGCQCSKIIYPLGNRDNTSCGWLVGKWQGNYNSQIVYVDTSYDSKKDVFMINAELHGIKAEEGEKIVPLYGTVSVINGNYYLNVITDVETLLQKCNYSDSNIIFFLPSICALKIQVSEDRNVLTIYTVDFSEKRKFDQKIKGLDTQMVFIDNSNVLLNTQSELTSFIKGHKFRIEPLITLRRIVKDNIK